VKIDTFQLRKLKRLKTAKKSEQNYKLDLKAFYKLFGKSSRVFLIIKCKIRNQLDKLSKLVTRNDWINLFPN
jgi:hypothetical protein